MRRAYLAKMIQEAAPELSPVRALAVAKRLVAGISSDLKTEGRVCLRGVGTLKVASRAARQKRNPRTGDAVIVPAGSVVRFRMSPALKAALNSGGAVDGKRGA